jgi:hypothetical protein
MDAGRPRLLVGVLYQASDLEYWLAARALDRRGAAMSDRAAAFLTEILKAHNSVVSRFLRQQYCLDLTVLVILTY